MLTKAELMEEVLALPVEDRLDVRAAIDDSLEPTDVGADSLSPEWRAEIERRLDELDSGQAELIPWEDVKSRLMAELAEMKASQEHAG